MTSNVFERVARSRRANAIKRCHLVPHHGEYNVGSHTSNMMSLLLIMHPDPSIALVKAICWHDVGELHTGDVPVTLKWSDYQLSLDLEAIEEKIRDKWGLNYPELTADEWSWLGALDKLELYCWALDQQSMGNSNVGGMMARLCGWFDTMLEQLPKPVRTFWEDLEGGPLPDLED